MKKILSLATLLSITSIASAGWSSSDGEVTAVYSHDGDHVIRTTITDTVCNAGNFWWPAEGDNANDAKDMFSLALTALASGKKIRVVYSPGDLVCNHGNSAKITHMVIYK